MFTLKTSFKPFLLRGGGGGGIKNRQQRWLWIVRRKTLKTFVPITSKNSASGQTILFAFRYGYFCMVAVGATNVGTITIEWEPTLLTNANNKIKVQQVYGNNGTFLST